MNAQNLLKINHQRIPTSIKAITPFKSENTINSYHDNCIFCCAV